MPLPAKLPGAFLSGLKKIRSRGPLVGLTYQILKDAIISGKLPPGAWLTEEPLTRALGISRTPLREAINRLESEGFIKVTPHKGAQVVQFTDQEIKDLFEAREAIESTFFVRAAKAIPQEELKIIQSEFERIAREWDAAIDDPVSWEEKRQAYLRLDRAFHDRLILSAGNRYWEQLYYNIRDKIEQFGYMLSLIPDRFRVAREEHQAIIEAMLKKDYIKGRQIMRRHIRNVQISVMTYGREKEQAGPAQEPTPGNQTSTPGQPRSRKPQTARPDTSGLAHHPKRNPKPRSTKAAPGH